MGNLILKLQECYLIRKFVSKDLKKIKKTSNIIKRIIKVLIMSKEVEYAIKKVETK